MKGERLILAHTFGAGGPDVELLMLAGGLLVLGVIFFFQKTVKPFVPVILIAAAFGLTAAAFALSGDDGATSPTTTQARVDILSPLEGAVVPAGEPLTLQIGLTDGELVTGAPSDDPNAGHIHVYWDGQITSMPSVTDPVVDAELVTPGEHEIIIEFVDIDHYPFDPSVQASVVITAE